MRQLRVNQPWADLGFVSEKDKLEDLVSRVQILESRIRELELQIAERAQDLESMSVGV